jgi:hypothetical protein
MPAAFSMTENALWVFCSPAGVTEERRRDAVPSARRLHMTQRIRFGVTTSRPDSTLTYW